MNLNLSILITLLCVEATDDVDKGDDDDWVFVLANEDDEGSKYLSIVQRYEFNM